MNDRRRERLRQDQMEHADDVELSAEGRGWGGVLVYYHSQRTHHISHVRGNKDTGDRWQSASMSDRHPVMKGFSINFTDVLLLCEGFNWSLTRLPPLFTPSHLLTLQRARVMEGLGEEKKVEPQEH